MAATWTCALAKNPGSNTAVDSWCMPVSPPRLTGPRGVPPPRPPAGAGDDQDPAVHVQHVHVVAVQPGQDLGA